MTVRSIFAAAKEFMTVSRNNPELLKAQYRAFSRQLPLMYFILVSSTWSVSITHMGLAPRWLAVLAPALLTLVSAIRFIYWWKSCRVDPTPDDARRALLRTNRFGALIAIAFTSWALLLYPYGNAYTKAQLAFYMAITVIGCIFSLTHLRSAALIVTVIVNGAFISFFALTGEPTLIATAVNIALVSLALLVLVAINYQDFTRMIDAQTDARWREQAQSRLLRMIDDMPVAVMTVDLATFRINYVNETSKRTLRRIEHLLPVRADQLVGTSFDVFHRHPEHQRRLVSDPANLPHRTRIRVGPEVLDLQVSAVNDADGNYIGPMLSWSIVTQQVKAEEHIHRLAHYDALTGLANRATFIEKMEKSLARAGNRTGLLYIDLDDFKLVNDSRGHGAGDQLLAQVAARLRDICAGSIMTIGRIGGDEFAVLLEDGDPEGAIALAECLVNALGAPYPLDGERQVRIGASIGIAVAPLHGETSGTLLSRADIALYAAKAAGKGATRVFLPEMEARVQERMRLEAKLRAALEENRGLFVFYQPIVDIRSGRITAREALVRWHHPQRGWISPAEFIPVAENSGLIDRLGPFVLNRACRDAARWQDGARVAVNVSAAQLGRGTLVGFVREALAGSGLPAGRLEIEVTETALLLNEGQAIAELRGLRDIGVRVALDDFGTGFSSLAHLRAFPFDKIKIDGSFVRDAVERPDCAAVVRAIADLGKRLGVTTVAEGVETPDQLACVTEEGCNEVQGYIFGRPMPDEQDAPFVEQLSLEVQLDPEG
ncbi:putative bifunctional diguanylate cyclase/phosphodiesterase [Paraburkholderia tropica]|uniref:putative bifunctional diguanylate cyclase/phosphodiesterase n=1 Tax=Paraburkholderia tropica TaxID=92647 RepID=UPI002AB78427|nr:EAL domain-containing protein [Paraburkholderia tropica]